MTAGSLEGSEATEHLERATITHGGAATPIEAAVLAPLVAIAVIVLAARLWTLVRGGFWRGAGPGWFLIMPTLAFVIGEFLERLTTGGETFGVHALREPRLLLALGLQVPFGAIAYAVARLLLAAARAILARVRASAPDSRRPLRSDVEPVTRIAPARWSCLVGARGLRGPPVVLPT